MIQIGLLFLIDQRISESGRRLNVGSRSHAVVNTLSLIVTILEADAERPVEEIVRDLNWIAMPVVTDRRAACRLINAIRGAA